MLTKTEEKLLRAAEDHAKVFDGDPRECVQTDVLNAFFAGAEFMRAELSPAMGLSERQLLVLRFALSRMASAAWARAMESAQRPKRLAAEAVSKYMDDARDAEKLIELFSAAPDHISPPVKMVATEHIKALCPSEAKCRICGRPLDNPSDPLSGDCGGDCLQCMADAGDLDCQAAVDAAAADLGAKDAEQVVIESLRTQLAEGKRLLREEMKRTNHYRKQLLATQAHVARLVEALKVADECFRFSGLGKCQEKDCLLQALSTPINLDALHEDRARTLEDAAEVILKLPRITGGVILPQSAYACLRDYLAPQHRAKKEN